ncbi:hypothetical protein GQ602_002410 [Ophiocordyceps camponoti-floridani]|uniref:Uncharacterized protein n=1 Tax=Ophiocordyceps camponoti-floridani TaxID=2030778 RepID=A0A8H4QAE8_9HYPO|nr:hypothetical protein GQ602_002410 [Ophiocordyceps camponoti-floridani]
MTNAWRYYVTSNQLITELQGLTPNYHFSNAVVSEAYRRVQRDPNSNRSWNLAWLCLQKIKDDDLIAAYAPLEAAKPTMWASTRPSPQEKAQLTAYFEGEWTAAVNTMLRHWQRAPVSFH